MSNTMLITLLLCIFLFSTAVLVALVVVIKRSQTNQGDKEEVSSGSNKKVEGLEKEIGNFKNK